MMKFHSIPTIVALLLFSRAPAQYVETHGWTFQGGNLVANWSFENLSTEICGPVNALAYGSEVNCRLKSTAARSGNYLLHAHMKNEGPAEPISWAVSQTSEFLIVKPETPYRFEVQYQVDWTENMNTARAVIGFLDGRKNVLAYAEGPRYSDLNDADVSAWSAYAFTFETPPQARYLYFHLVQVDNDGAVGDGDIYLFDNLVIREAAAPAAVLEARSYSDAVGRVDHSIFADGSRDIVSKSRYDAFGRPQEAFLPFTLSGLHFSDITVSALDLSGELPVDFPTLHQAYAALLQAAATTPSSAMPVEINVYVITHADEFAPMDPQSATLEYLVSVDGQSIPLILNGTVYGSQEYLDLKVRRSGTSAGHQTKGPFTGDVQAALAAQYPGESNLSHQTLYPSPGASRTHISSLPGALYGPAAHVQKSGSALIRSPALPSDPEAGGNTDSFQADYRYSWSRDPQGLYTAQVANAEGQVIRSGVATVPTPAGESDWQVSVNEYDYFGRLHRTISPENHFSGYTYDGMGRLILSDDPDRGATDYLYDAPGRLRFVRSAHGLAHGYFIAHRYDAAGRFLGRGKVDLPSAFTQANAENAAFPGFFFLDQGSLYDALEPSRFTEATGVPLTDLGFVPPVENGQGQVVARYHRNLETQAPGVAQAKDKLVATFDSYDNRGRLKDRWQYLGPAPAGRKWHKIQYSYDAQDRLLSVAVYDDAQGSQLATFSKYIYDAQGRVAQVVDEAGQPVAAYAYDFQNRLTEVDLLDKVKMGYTYDIQGKTRSLEAVAEGFPQPHVFSEYLGYEDKPYGGMTNSLDPARKRFDGGISSLLRKFSTAAPNPVEWWQYDYDLPGRMEGSGKHLAQSSALNPDGSLASPVTFAATAALVRDYQYDKDGALTSQSDGTTAHGYAYMDGTHQVDHVSPDLPGRSTATPGNFQYDEIGRLTQDAGRGTDFRYSVSDRPVEIGSGGKTFHLFYDANDNRVATLEETTPGSVQARKVYVYEVGLKVVKELVHRDAGHPDGTQDLQKNHHYGQGGLVAVSYGGDPIKQIPLKDHQGSVVGVVSLTGSTIDKEQGYLPFGGIEPRVAPGSERVPSAAWTGKEFEEVLGLYYFGARWMDPELGIFLTHDPAGQFHSPYAYGPGDPINGTDPDGEIWNFVVGAVVGGTIGYVTHGISTGDWTSRDAWKAAGAGALAGAITGGIGSFGTSLATNVVYGTLGNVVSYSANTMVFNGGNFSAGGFAGAIVGGAVGGFIPGFSGVQGGAFKNIAAEVGYSALKGAGVGALTGGLGAAFNGRNIIEGSKRGAWQGAISGAVGAGIKIAAFGHAKPSDALTEMKKINAESRKGTSPGAYKPVVRSGGLFMAVGRAFDSNFRGFTAGRNLLVPKANSGAALNDFRDDASITAHEYSHYLQQIEQGPGEFYAQGFMEQFFSKADPYITPGTNEHESQGLGDY